MKILSAVAAALVSLPEDLSERLNDKWVAVSVAGLFFLAGVGTHATFSDLQSHEARIGALETVVGIGAPDTLDDRVAALEDWQTRHVTEVTRPNVRRIGSIEEDIGQIKTWMERMEGRVAKIETLLSCQHYEIRECPGAPPPPPRRGP